MTVSIRADLEDDLRRLRSELDTLRYELAQACRGREAADRLKAENERLRAERDAVIALCLDHDNSGCTWWVINPLPMSRFFYSERAAADAVLAAAGIGKETPS